MSNPNLLNYAKVSARVPADFPPIRVALIACGKDKLDHVARARDLYTGPGFTDARGYVEAELAAGRIDAWFILSARYGLLNPMQVIGPYEATMPTKTVADRVRWVNKVQGQLLAGTSGLNLAEFSQSGGKVELTILASADYVNPLWPMLDAEGWTTHLPLEGLTQGHRRAWFRSKREAAALQADLAPLPAPADEELERSTPAPADELDLDLVDAELDAEAAADPIPSDDVDPFLTAPDLADIFVPAPPDAESWDPRDRDETDHEQAAYGEVMADHYRYGSGS